MKSQPRLGAKHEASDFDKARSVYFGALIAGPFLVIGFLVGYLLELPPFHMVLAAIAAYLIAALFIKNLSMAIAGAAGAPLLHALQPSGASTPYQKQYSYQESLAISGNVAGAIESYEAVILEEPDDIEARIRVAELYARSAAQPERAAEHFRAVMRTETAPPERIVYVSNRLVDLYLGPLNDEGRALVELRRLIERFPASAVAEQARHALSNLKTKRPDIWTSPPS